MKFLIVILMASIQQINSQCENGIRIYSCSNMNEETLTPSLINTNIEAIMPSSTLEISNSNLTELTEQQFNIEHMHKFNRLILYNTNTTEIEKDAFIRFENLQVFAMWNNPMERLPILRLPTLQELRINHNEINEILPNTFSYFSKVKVMDLGFNKLQQISSESFGNEIPKNFSQEVYKPAFMHLTKLYLNNNNLSVIALGAFSKMKNLEVLNLGFNRLSDDVFDSIALETIWSSDVTDLILDYNNITSIKPPAMKKFKRLKHLSLEFNSLNALEENTFSFTVLETLNLNSNHLDNLTQSNFSGLGKLANLYLKNNNIVTLKQDVFLHLRKLKILDLSVNLIEALTEKPFKLLEKLISLDLSRNKISIITRDAFEGLNALQFLSLAHNQIDSIPLGAFKHFPSLKTLQLQNNNLHKLTIGTFSNLPNLLNLNVSSNQLTYIKSNIFYPCRSLKTIILDNNNLTFLNYEQLVTSVPTLRNLTLASNNWKCHNLGSMLAFLRSKEINYLSGSIMNFDQENIEGISCFTTVQVKEAPENVMITKSFFDDYGEEDYKDDLVLGGDSMKKKKWANMYVLSCKFCNQTL